MLVGPRIRFVGSCRLFQTRDTGQMQTKADHGSRETSCEHVLDSLQLLRVNNVCRLLRISKPTFWRLRRAAAFPKARAQLTERVIAWSKREVELWLRERSIARPSASRTPRALPFVPTEAAGVADGPGQYKG